MIKVIFLDRDGVINFEPRDYTYSIDRFKIVYGLFESLHLLKDKGYQFIVITNQGGISKGIYNHKAVNTVHGYMQDCFKENNIDLLDIYYCPHHSVNEKCICRKPDSLMLEKAIARYNIDKTTAYFIGDSKRDILAAEKTKIKGVLVKSNDQLINYLNQIF